MSRVSSETWLGGAAWKDEREDRDGKQRCEQTGRRDDINANDIYNQRITTGK